MTPHEPSAWLRARAARVAARPDVRTLLRDDLLVVVPLGVTPSTRDDREDRTCDRCRVYTPPGPEFFALVYPAAPQLVLYGGLCAGCAQLENCGPR